MSRSFVEPDWIRFFDPKADWRDSLQHFNLHRDYIGGDGGVGITQMVHSRVEETTFPIRDWTPDCPARSAELPDAKNGRPDSLHQVCRLDCLKLLALGYLSAQVSQSRP
jgi:hypothetical protein